MEAPVLQANRFKVNLLDSFDKVDPETELDEIVLTDREAKEVTDNALKLALRQKRAHVHRVRYNQTLIELNDQEPKKFDSGEYFQMIVNRGNKLIDGKSFRIDSENEEVITKLTLYFSQDRKFEELDPLYGLHKGLLIYGNIGCGKTLLMQCLKNNQVSSYKVIPCSRIADEYHRETRALEIYSKPMRESSHIAKTLFKQDVSGICFDDLGVENTVNNFGTKMNVMERILTNWYDSNKWNMVHLTTNLVPDQIEEAYGARLRSRFKQMFNVIEFPKHSKSRR